MTAYLTPHVSRLYIQNKERGLVRLGDVMHPAQARLFAKVEEVMTEGKPVRGVILKARQVGFSTAVEAIAFVCAMCLWGMTGSIVAHKATASRNLLAMTKRYWNTWDDRRYFTPKYESRNELSWVETGSSLSVTTAGSPDDARSSTLHVTHKSEVAMWTDGEAISGAMNAAMPPTPFTFDFLESTAKGVGNYFHNEWENAKSGESGYFAMFFGWWEHPEYTADHIGMTVEADRPLELTDDEERELSRFLRKQGLDARDIRARLIWRRETIRSVCGGSVDLFHQEFPTTDVEAFLSSGFNVFPIHFLRAVFEELTPDRGRLKRIAGRVEFEHDPDGPLYVYKYPSPNRGYGQYTIGADPSQAPWGDYAVAQVVNRRTYEQCAVYRTKAVNQLQFADQIMMLADWYNQALLAPEANNLGLSATGAIVAYNYPNIYIHRKQNSQRGQQATTYGWVTNAVTKPEAVGNLQVLIIDAAQPVNLDRGQGIRIHDRPTFVEMKEYIPSPSGVGFTNSKNTRHDDTVMALAIAVTVTLYEAPSLALQQAFSEPRPYVPEVDGEPVLVDGPNVRLQPDGRVLGDDEGVWVDDGAETGFW